jgi:transposase InsO family protein
MSIGVIDDHTRLAHCELHAAENAHSVSATLRRASVWFGEQGCGPVQAVMSDDAKCYATSHDFRDALAELGARHILIPPRTPRWNGKIERFFRTLDTEWAHGQGINWPGHRANRLNGGRRPSGHNNALQVEAPGPRRTRRPPSPP